MGSPKKSSKGSKASAKKADKQTGASQEMLNSLPETTRTAVEGLIRRGGRVPKLPDKVTPPATQEVGRRLRRIAFELRELEDIGEVTRAYCRSLEPPAELAGRIHELLRVFPDCRVYREYMLREDEFLTAYVIEYEQSKRRGFLSAIEQVADATAKRLEIARLPTNERDRNRPASRWNPGGSGQAGVHVTPHPLASNYKPPRR